MIHLLFKMTLISCFCEILSRGFCLLDSILDLPHIAIHKSYYTFLSVGARTTDVFQTSRAAFIEQRASVAANRA